MTDNINVDIIFGYVDSGLSINSLYHLKHKYILKLEKALSKFVETINDDITRKQVVEHLQQALGYTVICNANNNPPELVSVRKLGLTLVVPESHLDDNVANAKIIQDDSLGYTVRITQFKLEYRFGCEIFLHIGIITDTKEPVFKNNVGGPCYDIDEAHPDITSVVDCFNSVVEWSMDSLSVKVNDTRNIGSIMDDCVQNVFSYYKSIS